MKTGRKGTVSFKFITIEEVAGEAITATATAFGANDTSKFSKAKIVQQL